MFQKPLNTGKVQDLARSATKWFYCVNYSYNDWGELGSNDFCRNNQRPFTADPDENTSGNFNPGQRCKVERKHLLERPKTAAPVLCYQGQGRHVRLQKMGYMQNTNDKEMANATETQLNAVKINNTEKERMPLDINSKIFKLAHGLAKTPNFRRSYDEDTISEESTSASESDEETSSLDRSYRLKQRNSGLSSMDMYREARETSQGSKEATALFRLAIERQRRLSIAPNEYSAWALKTGNIGSDKTGNSDHGKDRTEKSLPKLWKSSSSTKQYSNGAVSNVKPPAQLGRFRPISKQNSREGKRQPSNEKLSNSNGNKHEKITCSMIANSKLNENNKTFIGKEVSPKPEPYKGRNSNISLPHPTNASSARTAGNTLKSDKSKKDAFHDKRQTTEHDNSSVRSKIENEKTTTILGNKDRKIDPNELEKEDNEKVDTSKSRKAGVFMAPKIDPKVFPLAHSSTQALCQNVSVSTLNELKRIEEEAEILSSEDEDEIVEETTPDKKDDIKEKNEEEKDLKKELEMIHRRLQVSSTGRKKFALKSYVKPHLRYKTDRMYLLRRRNLLHRQIALAAQDSAYRQTSIPWPNQRLGLQVIHKLFSFLG